MGDVFIGSLGYALARVRVCVRLSIPRGVWGEKRPTRHMFFLRLSFFMTHVIYFPPLHVTLPALLARIHFDKCYIPPRYIHVHTFLQPSTHDDG